MDVTGEKQTGINTTSFIVGVVIVSIMTLAALAIVIASLYDLIPGIF